MAHQLPERYAGGAAHGQRGIGLLNDTLHLEPRSPDRYVLVLDSLIATFSHDPLAIGVYAAIARLTMAARDAVPLAARDLAAWMGSDRDADRAAIMRRIVKLEERGWVMVTRRTATKNSLLPTWGRDQTGVVRPGVLIRPIAVGQHTSVGDESRSAYSTTIWAGWTHSLVMAAR